MEGNVLKRELLEGSAEGDHTRFQPSRFPTPAQMSREWTQSALASAGGPMLGLMAFRIVGLAVAAAGGARDAEGALDLGELIEELVALRIQRAQACCGFLLGGVG